MNEWPINYVNLSTWHVLLHLSPEEEAPHHQPVRSRDSSLQFECHSIIRVGLRIVIILFYPICILIKLHGIYFPLHLPATSANQRGIFAHSRSIGQIGKLNRSTAGGVV